MTVAETEITTSADGTPLAFDRLGAGPPLILVGGAFNDRRTPGQLAELLAESFTVYTYDRRGRGDSGFTEPYAVEREVEDLEAVIEATGGSAALFGHSSGGSLALETTARGVSVSRLAIYEPPYIVDDSARPCLTTTSSTSRLERGGQAPRDRRLLHDHRRGDALRDGRADARLAHGSGDGATGPHGLPRRTGDAEGSMKGEPLPSEWTDSVIVRTLVMDGGEQPGMAAQRLPGAGPRASRRSPTGP